MSSAQTQQAIEIGGHAPDDLIKPRELHHVNLRTRQLDAMIDFYGTLVGMQPTFRGPQFAAIGNDEANHRIALLALDFLKEPSMPIEQRFLEPGYEHMAFEYDHLDELLHNYLRLKRAGIEPYWTVNHGATMSFYYRDPEGNNVELQVDACDHDLARWKEILEGDFFQRNQIGAFVSPEKIIEARNRGVSEQEILTESYKETDTPYSGPPSSPFDTK